MSLKKLLIIRNYIDYFRRKLWFAVTKVRLLRSDAVLAPSIDVSPFTELSVRGGKLRLEDKTLIQRGVIIRTYGANVRIGRNCTIGPYAIIYGGGPVYIGDAVRIGPHCVIVGGNHIYTDPETPIYQQGMRCVGIKISDDVWLGAGVKILDGVSVGKGAVVAAGSVVTKSVNSFAIMAGVPARVIGYRGKKNNSPPQGKIVGSS